MAGTDRGTELPRRIRGAAWTGPLSPVAPVGPALSPELRQRMQAAVWAERTGAVARGPERGAGNRTAGPGPEDEVTAWLGSAAEPPSAARLEPVVRARPAGGPEPAVGPQAGKTRRRARARLVVPGLALVVIGSLAAVTAIQHFSRPPTAQEAALEAVSAQAAAWVAGQVGPDVTVSCDAEMCAALKAHGFPAGELVMLGSASPDPVPSDLVVETAAVRALFGNSLALAWAPAVLASFGSGPGAVTVRVVAPHGAAAYQTWLDADLADRKRSGAALLNDSRVTLSATARSQLVAGQADSRLLTALAALAGHLPIDIMRFGSLGPGASPGVPLCFADLAESVPAARMDAAAYMRAAWAVLSGTAARIRPARVVSGVLQHQAVLRVEFTAPSSLGKSSSGWS